MKKGIIFFCLFFNHIHGSFRRSYDPTPAEKKFLNSLRATYDPFKDVRLNDKRLATVLPLLTREALKRHGEKLLQSERLLQKSDQKKPVELPIPPLQLRTLPYSKRSYDRANLDRD